MFDSKINSLFFQTTPFLRVCFCKNNIIIADTFVTRNKKTPEEHSSGSRQTPFNTRQNQVVLIGNSCKDFAKHPLYPNGMKRESSRLTGAHGYI